MEMNDRRISRLTATIFLLATIALSVSCGVGVEPTITPQSDFLEAHGISHLAGNLLFVAHWDADSQKWLVYDVAGEFTLEQLEPPAPSDVGALTRLESGKVYDFRMRWDQIVNLKEGETGDWVFDSGPNLIKWP